jgi:hypothetical protein
MVLGGQQHRWFLGIVDQIELNGRAVAAVRNYVAFGLFGKKLCDRFAVGGRQSRLLVDDGDFAQKCAFADDFAALFGDPGLSRVLGKRQCACDRQNACDEQLIS